MIYLECNMNAYIGYNISDTSDYLVHGRENIISGIHIKRWIQELTSILEAVDNNNLRDSMKLSLCTAEVIHLQNLYFESKKHPGHVLQFSTDDISKSISIIDNIKLNKLRLILINDHNFYGDTHYSILQHREKVFDNQLDCITIFIDQEFVKGKNNKQILRLIFNCMDYFISEESKVTYNVFSEHPLAMDKTMTGEDYTQYDELSPRMVFRNRFSTMDILFISEYLIAMCYYLKKWFRVRDIEMQYLFSQYPIYKFIGGLSDEMSDIDEYFDNEDPDFPDTPDQFTLEMSINIEDHLNEPDEFENIMNYEYKLAEQIRDNIMNMPYKEE